MAKVSLKSTKQEILDALHAAEKQLEAQKKVMSILGEAAEKAKEEAVISAAAADVEAGIFSEEMNAKYQNLTDAIAALEAKLKTLYDIDAELADMVVVVNAKKQAQINLDTESEKQRAEIADELERVRRDFAAEVDRMESENANKKAELDRTREREQEQYDYDTARKRKLDADAYADKMAAMDKKLAEAAERLAALKADADAITAMQSKIDAVPDKLEAKYQAGFADGQKAAGKDYGYKTAMADKEHSFEIRERDSRIERLEADCKEKSGKISALEAKLDAAYAQLRDLATKTVESSGGVKVISAGSDSPVRK